VNPAPRRRPLVLLALAAAAALVVALAVVLSRSGGDEAPPPAPGAAPTLFSGLPQDGATLGEPAAPATLIEYADLQCPFCAQYASDVLPSIVDRYVRSGRLKLELRPLAFIGEDSVRAARVAAAAALQDRMWPFTEYVFANQGAENSGWVTDAFLREATGAVPGLDGARALAEADSPAARRLLAEAERSATAAGVDSTPSFLLRRGDGTPRPLEVQELSPAAFASALDAALR
jgi:protein-disulfide isomerase